MCNSLCNSLTLKKNLASALTSYAASKVKCLHQDMASM